MFPNVFTAIHETAKARDGEDVNGFSETIQPLAATCGKHGCVPTIKSALKTLGIIDSAAVRSPLTSLSVSEQRDVGDVLDDVRTIPDLHR